MKVHALISAALLLLLLNFRSYAQEEELYKTLEIGAAAPDFKLPGIDGKEYTLGSFDKYAVLALVFTANHCPAAQAYEDRLIALTNEYRGKSVAIVAVNPNDPLALRLDELGYTEYNDSFEEMQLRAKDKGFNFIYLDDGKTQAMARKYGPATTPHSFVFNKARKLIYTGRIDGKEEGGNSEDIRAAIEAGLAGKMPAVTKTKTFGCSTKWSEKRHTVTDQLAVWAKLPVTLEEIDEAGLKELVKNNGKKLRLINVWATWCGPCVVEFPDLVKADRMFRHRAFEFVSVSADKLSRKEEALDFLKEQEASNKNYIFNINDKYKLIEAIDPEWQGNLPYTILVEPGGEIAYRISGQLDLLRLRKAIVDNHRMGRAFE